jgi:hypothetical protein
MGDVCYGTSVRDGGNDFFLLFGYGFCFVLFMTLVIIFPK